MSNKEFELRKEKVVSSLVEYLDPERRDKSPKGFIDEPILDLMHVINQHPDYYTTSSCSGRIAIYCEGIQESEKTTKGGIWLYVSHDPIQQLPTTDKEILDLVFGQESSKVKVRMEHDIKDMLSSQLIYFKFEPLILHIEASSHEKAMDLLNIANQVGYQNSGITPSRRHMLSIRSTLKIDTPIAYIKNEEIYCLVEPSYLLLLLNMSNEKFQQNISRMDVFEQVMKDELVKLQDRPPVLESREERKQRKKKEGLLLKMQQQTKPQQIDVLTDDLNFSF